MVAGLLGFAEDFAALTLERFPETVVFAGTDRGAVAARGEEVFGFDEVVVDFSFEILVNFWGVFGQPR